MPSSLEAIVEPSPFEADPALKFTENKRSVHHSSKVNMKSSEFRLKTKTSMTVPSRMTRQVKKNSPMAAESNQSAHGAVAPSPASEPPSAFLEANVGPSAFEAPSPASEPPSAFLEANVDPSPFEADPAQKFTASTKSVSEERSKVNVKTLDFGVKTQSSMHLAARAATRWAKRAPERAKPGVKKDRTPSKGTLQGSRGSQGSAVKDRLRGEAGDDQREASEQDTKQRRRSVQRSSGLSFQIGKVRKVMKKHLAFDRMQKGTDVFLTGIIECVCSELLEGARMQMEMAKKKRILPRHIWLAIQNDVELKQLLGHGVIPGAGVAPHVHPALL